MRPLCGKKHRGNRESQGSACATMQSSPEDFDLPPRSKVANRVAPLPLGMLRLTEPPTGRARLRLLLNPPRHPTTPIETSRVATLHPGLYKGLREGVRRVDRASDARELLPPPAGENSFHRLRAVPPLPRGGRSGEESRRTGRTSEFLPSVRGRGAQGRPQSPYRQSTARPEVFTGRANPVGGDGERKRLPMTGGQQPPSTACGRGTRSASA